MQPSEVFAIMKIGVQRQTALLEDGLFKTPPDPKAMTETQLLAVMESWTMAVFHELEEATRLINELNVWVRLQIPRVEDGNNFGVSIIDACERNCAAWEEHLTNMANNLFCALENGAILLGNALGEQTTKKNDGSAEVEVSHKVTLATNWRMAAFHAQICSTFLVERRRVLNIRAIYMFAMDLFTKNMEKLLNPRGSADANQSYHS